MAYYNKVIQAGESVKFMGKLHWIIYMNAIIVAATGVAGVLVCGLMDSVSVILVALVGLLFIMALMHFLRAWFRRATTEIVVTDKRVIFKEGWISRHTEEMNVSKVESVDIDQGVIGRVLGFGEILIRGTGSTWEPISWVANPLELRNAIIAG